MPAASRTAKHSRATAACMSSPGLGYHQGRCHWPTGSNTAPEASCHSCIAVRRTGSISGPVSRPASAPKVTGV